MGEINKILATGKVRNSELAIELNYPVSHSGKQSIHIQTGNFRLELGLSEYRALAAAILDANSILSIQKTRVQK